MKRKTLSFLMAGAAISGLFFSIHTLRQDEGKALASSVSVAGRMIESDARYSAFRKRSIRQAVMSSADEFMNLKGGEVRAVLNQPELVRRDLPTIVWQYRNDACVLDIYFTVANAKVNKAPVAHYEIRARQKGVTDEDVRDICVKNLIRAQAGKNFINFNAFYKTH